MKWDVELNNSLKWSQEITNYDKKMNVAKKIASFVKDGDVIGAGSGSTSFLAIQEIAKRIKKENLHVRFIPTSFEIKAACVALGLNVISLSEAKPDWCYDGADEVDPHHWLIKGRGGAMFNEKLVMKCAAKKYIIVDSSKFVNRLCEKFPVPVECVPAAAPYVMRKLYSLGAKEVSARFAGKSKDGPVITENGNYIIDAKFDNVNENLEKEIKAIVGVVESGLFIGYDVEVLDSD